MIPENVRLCMGQRMMLMRTASHYMPSLLMSWLNSPAMLATVRRLTGGTASPHLNIRDIRNFPVPVPPVDEQHEITRRVETLFAYADRLEARYAAASEQVEQLTPSLLAKAFRGELVSHELRVGPTATPGRPNLCGAGIYSG
jgi:type I restriction enzyme S subunit